MSAFESWPKLVGTIVLCIVVYEVIRSFVLRSLFRRFDRSVRQFMREAELSLETYRFTSKIVVLDELMSDPVLNEWILDHAAEKDLRIEDVRDQAEAYLDEIVPAFNILSYYQVGMRVARAVLNLLYEVVVEHRDIESVENLPERSVVIFVANHRSNVDYVLMAFLLSRHVTLSYAVGEWARVWPLEHLFKSFGSYFIRRGFRDELYHTVLRRYVQHISRRGLNQGIFIEGGLSRDGQLRDPKVGLLDYLIQLKAEDDCDFDIVFVPVGVNFDWVLEDTTLLAEASGLKARPTLMSKLISGGRLLVEGPPTLIANALRLATGRIRRHGYASAHLGPCVRLDQYMAEQDPELPFLERSERLGRVKVLADHLMGHIHAQIPVTPVPLTCAAIQLHGRRVASSDLKRSVVELRKAFAEEGRPIVMGSQFVAERGAREKLGTESAGRRSDLLAFEEGSLDLDEAEVTLEVALEILVRRGIVREDGSWIVVEPGQDSLVHYYASSLAPPRSASNG